MNVQPIDRAPSDEAPRCLEAKTRCRRALKPLLSLLLLTPTLGACAFETLEGDEMLSEQSTEELTISEPKVVTASLNGLTTTSPIAVLASDVNGDRKTDLVIPRNLGGRLGLSVYRNLSYYRRPGTRIWLRARPRSRGSQTTSTATARMTS